MNQSFSQVSLNAEQAILAHGGTVTPDPDYPKSLWRVDVDSELVESKDRAGWGNLSIRVWKLSEGNFLAWDSEERRLTFSSHG